MLGEEVYNKGEVSLRVLDRTSDEDDWRQMLEIQRQKTPAFDKVYCQIGMDLESKEKILPTSLMLYIRSKLAGFILLDLLDVYNHQWRMLEIYVDPDFREKGFAGYLFDCALQYINRGTNELGYFEVDPDLQNLPVRKMLIRRGVTLPKDKRNIIPTRGHPLTDDGIRSFRGFPVNLAPPSEWQPFPLNE